MDYLPHDRSLIDTSVYTIGIRLKGDNKPTNVELQFPPHIQSDGRRGEWKESSGGPSAGDKIAVYTAADPRIISVELTYVVDGASWTSEKIKKQLQLLRGYFRNPFIEAAGGTPDNPSTSALSPMVILLKIWSVGGPSEMSFRLDSVGVRHGKTFVGVGQNAFPLHTVVSLSLKSWPKIGDNPPAQTVPGQLVYDVSWY